MQVLVGSQVSKVECCFALPDFAVVSLLLTMSRGTPAQTTVLNPIHL